ncbi:MAG: hypothetical protein IJY61_09165 [Candidatus Gastranaerophilales bacterium]|nr:hypothetical protein [Candidatus Gastranaerophilales bacterium]
MNLTIGMTTSKVLQSKSAVIGNQKPKQQAYSNNVFDEFSKKSTENSKNNVCFIPNTSNSTPSFKGSTTA